MYHDVGLSHGFEKAAEPAVNILRSDRVLNYVWINKSSLNTAKEPSENLCGVPLGYMDKAFENARLYPGTKVDIWLDDKLLDKSSRYFVQAHAYLNAPENVAFRDLRSIPAYAASPVFAEKTEASIWQRVDLARFMVLQHCFDTGSVKTAYYSDFDVEDVMLDYAGTAKQLDKNGIAFAKLPEPERITHFFINSLSPGYIAVNEKGHAYLAEKLVPELTAIAESRRTVVLNMFLKLTEHFGNAEMDMRNTLDTLLTDVPIYPCGRVMPENPAYAAAKLCPSYCGR